jgi:hypothetical protein
VSSGRQFHVWFLSKKGIFLPIFCLKAADKWEIFKKDARYAKEAEIGLRRES